MSTLFYIVRIRELFVMFYVCMNNENLICKFKTFLYVGRYDGSKDRTRAGF